MGGERRYQLEPDDNIAPQKLNFIGTRESTRVILVAREQKASTMGTISVVLDGTASYTLSYTLPLFAGGCWWESAR